MTTQWLLFQLAGAMASFGGVAVGEVRSSESMPTRSAILGLLAAALGIRRDQDDQHAALSNALQFAARLESVDSRMLDFHTAQSAKRSRLKGRPLRTRRDELQAEDLWTIEPGIPRGLPSKYCGVSAGTVFC